MILTFRNETTIDELRAAARKRTFGRKEVKDTAQSLTDATCLLNVFLADLQGKEPEEAAQILGDILNNALDAVVLLRLDPAGCMSIAAIKALRKRE